MSHYTQKGPGELSLSGVPGSFGGKACADLKFSIQLAPDFAAKMRESGYALTHARPLAAFTRSVPDSMAVAEALRVFGGVEDPWKELEENRGRVASWYEGLREMIIVFYGLDGDSYDKNKGQAYTDKECLLTMASGKGFKCRFNMQSARGLQVALMHGGWPPEASVPTQAVSGFLDELCLGILLVLGTEHSNAVDLNQSSVWGFLEENRTVAAAWWQAFGEMTRRYYKDEAEAQPPGEGVGAGSAS